MTARITIEDGYRIVLPESLHGRFHVGDEIVIEQDRDGRLIIVAAPDEEILTYLLGGEESPLGRQLRELRQQIVATGVPLLDSEALEREVEDRRGERR